MPLRPATTFSCPTTIRPSINLVFYCLIKMGHFKNKAKEWDCLSDRTNIVFFGLLLLIVKCTVTMSINIAVLMAK